MIVRKLYVCGSTAGATSVVRLLREGSELPKPGHVPMATRLSTFPSWRITSKLPSIRPLVRGFTLSQS